MLSLMKKRINSWIGDKAVKTECFWSMKRQKRTTERGLKMVNDRIAVLGEAPLAMSVLRGYHRI